MSQRTDYVIVKDRFPRISEVLNDCVGNLCVRTSIDEPLSSILAKICGKITSMTTPCCYTFSNTETVTFEVSDDNIVTATAIASASGSVTQVDPGNGMDFVSITATGSVTLGTPSSITLASTNSVSSTSHTHAFIPGGASTQLILGDGSLLNITSLVPTLTNTRVAFGGVGNVMTSDSAFTYNSTTDILSVNFNRIGGSNGNVFFGDSAFNDTATGSGANTAIGIAALVSTTTGSDNVAIGWHTMISNTTGLSNTAVGSGAMSNNTTGGANTAVGASALAAHNGTNNTAIGSFAMGFGSNVGDLNTAIGVNALRATTTGSANVAVGVNSLRDATTAIKNVALGAGAMELTTTGGFNVAVGEDSLLNNANGTNNIAIGWLSGAQNPAGVGNISIGFNSNTIISGDNNIFIGKQAGSGGGQTTTITNSIAIGADAVTTASNQIVLGHTTITQAIIRGTTTLSSYGSGTVTGTPTYTLQVDSTGKIIEGSLTPSTTLYTGDGTLLSDRTIDIDGYDLLFVNGTDALLSFLSVGFASIMSATDGTATSTLELRGDDADPTVLFRLTTANSVNNVVLEGDAVNNWITLTTGTLRIADASLAGSVNGYVWTLVDNGTGEGEWAAPASGGTVAINDITAATGTTTIDNTNFTQTWNWNSLTNGTGLVLGSNATIATTGQKLMEMTLQGAHAASSVTSTTLSVQNIHTGTTSTNIGMDVSASGATTNIALQASGGSVNVGTASTAVAAQYLPLKVFNTSNSSSAITEIKIYNDGGTTASDGLRIFLASSTFTSLNNGAGIWNAESGELSFGTGNTRKVTITSGGTLLLSGLTSGTNTWMNIGAGTTAVSQINLATGTLRTTPVGGDLEYATPGLYFTNGGAQRQELFQGQQSRVSTQFDKANTTLANITGLTATLVAAKTYRFEATLYTTSNIASGVKFAVAGTATATSIVYEAIVIDANINAAQTRATALATTVGAVTAVTNALCTITGNITCANAGTLTVQFADNAGANTSSILVGSTFVVIEMV